MSEQFVQLNVTGARAKRLTYASKGNAQLESVNLPEIATDFVLVKTLFSGISRGTESLVYHGNVPDSEWERMRCPNMIGAFSFPVSYGYACVGEVVSTGPDTKRFGAGDHVFILHPHQNLSMVREEECNPLPDGLHPRRAVLAANSETAVNATWDAQIIDKPSCAVIGAGVVGLLTAHAARQLHGLDPVILDVNPEKEKHVNALGFQFVRTSEPSISTAGEFDLIFHTSATAGGLQAAIDIAGFEATIIEMSWYGTRKISLNLGGAFHARRLKIVSSQVGHIAPQKRSEISYADRMQIALSLLDDNRLDVLLEQDIEFELLPDHLENIFNTQSNVLCQVVKY